MLPSLPLSGKVNLAAWATGAESFNNKENLPEP